MQNIYDGAKFFLKENFYSMLKMFMKVCTVKLCEKERFDKEQIGVKEPFPVTKCQFNL